MIRRGFGGVKVPCGFDWLGLRVLNLGWGTPSPSGDAFPTVGVTPGSSRSVDCASYVSEIVLWPWPMGAADHTGRHFDLRHITDWPRWGCLRHRWTERRLSWCAILFVSRSSLHRARSARADCRPPVNPIYCAACRRIRAIENCVSRLISAARSTTSDDVGSTWRQIESDQSPR